MKIQQILTELDKFKGKLSKTKQEKWQSNISELLSSPDGITALKKRLEPDIKISRPILRVLVSQIQLRLESSESNDKDDLTRLLELVGKNDTVDSDARWSALSVILSIDESNRGSRTDAAMRRHKHSNPYYKGLLDVKNLYIILF